MTATSISFSIEGPKSGVVAKQALPYVRLVGESWPLPLCRAHFEHAALVEEIKSAAPYVPAIYEHDADMALTVMEYLSPHIILRKGLIRGIKYPKWRSISENSWHKRCITHLICI